MSRIRANTITNAAGTGAPTFPNGINVTGVITATTFSGVTSGVGINTVGGNLGYGVTTIDFRGNGISNVAINNTLGIATISVSSRGVNATSYYLN